MSSTLKMPLITLFLSFLFINSSIAGYTLEDDYSVSSFFDMFSFFTTSDPTHGFVDYIDRSTAESSGLISTTASTIYIGTDHENVTPSGRPSIRLTSNKAYNAGSLVILDLAHMPGGICGTWPAFWMVGPDWPAGGEIDIIEGVNEQSTNAMTLHTDPGCSINSNGDFSGSVSTSNCDINASGQTANAGCSIDSSNTQSYGTDFNGVGGGVYATEWTNTSISVWFFSRSSIPGDITAGSPDPSSWGTPSAQFSGGCDIPQFFQDNQIVFDLTYCGDWAGNVWSDSSCSSLADTCIDYVENNPDAFQNAYWSINSLQVFQYSSTSSSPTSSAQASSTTASLPLSAGVSTTSQISSSTEASSSTTSSEDASSSSSSASSATESSSSTASSSASSSPATSSSASSSSAVETSSASSSTNRWGWHRSSSTDSATSSATSSASLSLSFSGVGRVVSHSSTVTSNASSTASDFSAQTSSTLSSASSSMTSTGVSSSTAATTLSAQISTTASQDSSSVPATSTVALLTNPSAVDGSISTAVPSSLAEMAAKVQAMADLWSTSQPSNWQDEIDALEDALEAASSQAAAVSAKLKQNQKRHLLHHKKRFTGHH